MHDARIQTITAWPIFVWVQCMRIVRFGQHPKQERKSVTFVDWMHDVRMLWPRCLQCHSSLATQRPSPESILRKIVQTCGDAMWRMPRGRHTYAQTPTRIGPTGKCDTTFRQMSSTHDHSAGPSHRPTCPIRASVPPSTSLILFRLALILLWHSRVSFSFLLFFLVLFADCPWQVNSICVCKCAQMSAHSHKINCTTYTLTWNSSVIGPFFTQTQNTHTRRRTS